MTEVKGYHAHVYYDAATKPKAAKLRETIIGKFKVEPGGFSDEPRGPHPISQFNVIFETPEFQILVPWMAEPGWARRSRPSADRQLV
jgi:aromatic ring-cleaving dioxygenase